MAAPNMTAMPMAPVQTGMVTMTGQVRERTGLGFALDTIRIPIPFLRPIAVQRPPEVNFQMPLASVPTAGAGFVAPAGMMMPVAPMAMTAPVMANNGFVAANNGFVAPSGGVAMVSQPTVGFGQVTVQGQMPAPQLPQGQFNAQQLALLQALLAAQQQAGGSAGGGFTTGQPQPGGGSGAGFTTGGSAQDRLRAAEQQLRELEQLCEKLKQMKQQEEMRR